MLAGKFRHDATEIGAAAELRGRWLSGRANADGGPPPPVAVAAVRRRVAFLVWPRLTEAWSLPGQAGRVSPTTMPARWPARMSSLRRSNARRALLLRPQS
jgi:hypothetical protein